eukprot:TRINITY_DN15217_c0_g1_i5.p1 TRINITY_DN15217_c0_g1~~TRINITY_DN15217_c0_g1_i5.p1  ORF type:complete len:693 (+),score=30.33 TRINITY_DN15217_c0_g1_i5:159-2237(+)
MLDYGPRAGAALGSGHRSSTLSVGEALDPEQLPVLQSQTAVKYAKCRSYSAVALGGSICRQQSLRLGTGRGNAHAAFAERIGARSGSCISEDSLRETACAFSHRGTSGILEPTGKRNLLWRAVSAASWTAFVMLACAAIVSPFLMVGRSCHENMISDPSGHVTSCVLALGLALAFPRLRSLKSRASPWIQRYAVSFFFYALCQLMSSWLVQACPFGASVTLVVYATVRICGALLTYVLCQLCLGYVSVVRLQLMGLERQASQAARLAQLAVGCGLFATLACCFSFLVGGRPLFILAISLAALGLTAHFVFQVRVLTALLQAGRSALWEARRSKKPSKQARAALLTAIAVALSSSTTFPVIMAAFVKQRASTSAYPLLSWQWWILCFDLSTDVFLAIVCSGLVTAEADQERNFKIAGELAEAARREKVLLRLKEAARTITGPSVSLAALFEGKDPEELLEVAVQRFRCVSWETLRRHPYLMIGGGPLDGVSVASDLYDLSKPCKLSECDAFFSHSWHDDPWGKWRDLAQWCKQFTEAHGRPPYLWFDKLCIDQTDIDTDLQCLPIFLAGCSSLLVSCGKTYTSRLWCCVELFVFMKMALGCDHQIHVRISATEQGDRADIAKSWTTFDVRQCRCFLADDKRRILECIEKDNGVDDFNEYIRCLAANLFGGPSADQDQEVPAVSTDSDLFVVPV